jgi:RNA polymerase sigma-70 factor (ECF subfamily)
MRPAEHDLEPLLAHSRWVRGLARRLVADPHAAEDLVQETWVAALERPPQSKAPWRAWLATVVRNFAHQAHRGAGRRAGRERASARDEAQPSALDVVANLSVQQELAQAVLALEEPYRSTVYRRYYAGLAPAAIARLDGVPVKTVKTRLARGLEQLRARLDREHGGRAAWLPMLVPFLGRDHAALAVLGGIVVQLKLVLGFAVVSLLAVAVLIVAWPDPHEGTQPSLARSSAEERATLEEGSRPPLEPASVVEPPRAPAGAARAAAQEPVAAVAPARTRGRVIDVEGAPVHDVDVVLAERWGTDGTKPGGERPVLARTDAQGAFEAAPLTGTSFLEVDDERWTTVLRSCVRGDATRVTPTIVVARPNPIGGLVVDVENKPIPGAKLHIELAEALRRDLGQALDTSQAIKWDAVADGNGHFELPRAPRAPGELVVASTRHAPYRAWLPEVPTPDLVIVLQPFEKPHVVLAGRVVDAEDRPVPKAWVVLGSRSQATDAQGRFEIDASAHPSGGFGVRGEDGVWRIPDDKSELRAAKAGYLPAVLPLPPFEELAETFAKEPIVLRLGPPPLSIRGRVEDAEGHPVPGVKITLLDETLFGTLPGASNDVTWQLTFEQLLRGGLNARDVVTDAKGEFEHGGLLDRTYGLFCLDTRTLRRTEVQGVRAGTRDLVVRFGAEDALARVAGRVVGKNGDPIGGVRVIPVFQVPNSFLKQAQADESDAQGRFEFAELSPDGLGFQITSEHLFFVFHRPVEPGEDLDDLELVVSRRCYVQIDLGDRKELADRAVPENAQGKRTQIMEFLDSAIAFPEHISIVDGKSEVVSVEEDTTVVVLYKGETEVGRKSVTVVPAERVVVGP